MKGYLKGWFVLDLISCLPMDLIIESIKGIFLIQDKKANSTIDFTRFLKLTRLYRLFRLIRLFKLPKFMYQEKSYFSEIL